MHKLTLAAIVIALVAAMPWVAQEARADEVVARGGFYDGPHAPQHRVSGDAVIVRTDTGGYRLDITDLVSDQGPDLFFIVSTAVAPKRDAQVRASDWQIIGRRKALTGDQSYELQGFDPERHRSVILWCKQYAVMFGGAALDIVNAEQ